MRLVFISTYWPEYSGPAVRMRELNKYFKEDVIILCPNRFKRGFKFEKHKEKEFIEYIFSFRTFYLLDFLIGLLISFILPKNKLVHVLGSSPLNHALFLVSNFRKDIRILFELVCSDSSPIISFKKLAITIKPNKKRTLILPLNKGQSFKGFNFIIKPNAISEEIIVQSDKRFLKRNFIKENNEIIYLGYLSKFKEIKNQSFLIDVIRHLPRNYKLILFGPYFEDDYFKNGISNKDYLIYLKNKITEFDLKSRIVLKTGIFDPIKFYKKIDIYLNPSMEEGFGTTFIEAVAFGLPVVANKEIQSFRECSKYCFSTVKLVSISNPKKFAKSIVRLNIKITKEALKESRNNIIKNFSKNKIFSIYKRAYIELRK